MPAACRPAAAGASVPTGCAPALSVPATNKWVMRVYRLLYFLWHQIIETTEQLYK